MVRCFLRFRKLRVQADVRYIQVLNRRHMAFEPPSEGACALSARLLHGLLAIFPQMHNVRPSMLSYEIREQLQQVIHDACQLQVRRRRMIVTLRRPGEGGPHQEPGAPRHAAMGCRRWTCTA